MTPQARWRLPAGLALALVILVVLAGCVARRPGAMVAGPGAPAVLREFRGVWVATVANIDWPSKRGLSTAEQQKELLAILDKAVELNLNAVILQVRPAGDALYDSKIEPWSEYLTGTQGKPPEPYYDPLAFAIDEAHRRGLELHAWFNPYRVGHNASRSPPATNHLSRTRPDLVRRYGPLLWLDPGEPGVQDHALSVILDVVHRYDVDGVHLDDYFYPYPQRDDAGKVIPFPDSPSFERYRRTGGVLARNDWRRENVNGFVRRLYKEIKREKPYVKLGISPFGIWQPGHPAYIVGMNQYDTLFADAKLWLNEGWCDYFSPQLYWPIEKPEQSFVSLLQWWSGENTKLRHLWPGLYTSRTGDDRPDAFDAEEVSLQIEWTRALEPEDRGHVHFSAEALMKNQAGIADTLRREVYQRPALVPPSWWLARGSARPAPVAKVSAATNRTLTVAIDPTSLRGAWQWVVQVERNGEWGYAIVPASRASHMLPLPSDRGRVGAVYAFTVDRLGIASEASKLPLSQPIQAALDRDPALVVVQ